VPHWSTHLEHRLDGAPQALDCGRRNGGRVMGIISVLIGILIIVVVGAICFWAIERFSPDRKLGQLLKLLVVLVCLGAIVQRLLMLTY
jgi:hypothetical protein